MNRRPSSRNRALDFAFQPTGEPLGGGVDESELFVARDGQICLRLAPAWPELLGEISRLGPVGIVTSHGEMRQAECVPGVEFAPMPDGGAWIDLASGAELSMDTRDWLFALAVEERTTPGTLYGFQFFDYQARGQLKILLTSKSDLDIFVEIASRFGIGGIPPGPVPIDKPLDAASAPPVIVPDAAAVRGLWPRMRHDLPGRFFPGLPGVTRQAALRVAGHDLATPMETGKLVAGILDARRGQKTLRCTLFNRYLVHSVEVTPRRLEHCPHFLHVLDEAAEFHVPLAEIECWRRWDVKGCGYSVDLLTLQGDRLAMIEGW